MYHPTTRVLAVLELLQAHGRLSGSQLAARLEIDRRSVRRYILMLQELGIPVEGERGRHGAYRLRPGFKLPPLMFTDDEALALTLGLLAARRLGLATAAPAVEGALAKVDRVLPQALREQVRAVQEMLVLDLAAADPAAVGEAVVALSLAAHQGRRVRIRYRSWSSESERAIDPYGVVFHAGRWYLAAWCHLRAGVRIFRVDRILHIEPTGETFVRPPEFDSLAAVIHALAIMPGTWAVEISLELSAAEAARKIPPPLGTLEAEPGGVALRCHVADLDWLAHFLVGLGCPFAVRQPPELLDALERLGARIARAIERAGPAHTKSPPSIGGI